VFRDPAKLEFKAVVSSVRTIQSYHVKFDGKTKNIRYMMKSNLQNHETWVLFFWHPEVVSWTFVFHETDQILDS
jgi:lysophospholipid acyltransferase (LPLAT)-like uncharacterized protein